MRMPEARNGPYDLFLFQGHRCPPSFLPYALAIARPTLTRLLTVRGSARIHVAHDAGTITMGFEMAQDHSGSQGLNPGEEDDADSPQTGEDVCRECHGEGYVDDGECPKCGGTGKAN